MYKRQAIKSSAYYTSEIPVDHDKKIQNSCHRTYFRLKAYLDALLASFIIVGHMLTVPETGVKIDNRGDVTTYRHPPSNE